MGWIVFLVAIGIGGLLFWQNLQAITLIFFGGVMTVTLPIALWVLLFTGAGIISSLTLQFLYSFGRPLARPREVDRTGPRPSPSSIPPRQPYAINEDSRSTVPPTVPPASRPRDDWERDSNADDWNVEVPPEQPTRIQEPEIRDRVEDRTRIQEPAVQERVQDRSIADEKPADSENSPPPAPRERTAAVYSYSYRTARQTRGESGDTVYDANYRIITPPDREETGTPANPDEDEDWI
ncbi:hypothetical protein V0288_08195 [Pannus brasiliensis CCIBt3594]|uniref:LapA family protein n=1 Tax=Pannus brasiliensis CCIBt3594 TaxID=1427578 RepID=A0AAW9QPF9_9CHRO